jgi:transcription-repair coupling factor (superfamily II helicase)
MSSVLETTSVLRFVLGAVRRSREYAELLDLLGRGERVISLRGLAAGAARPLVLAALQEEAGRPFAVVAETGTDLENWARDLSFWQGALRGEPAAERVVQLPAPESDPYAGGSPHADTLEQRALALWQIGAGNYDFAVLSARSLMQRTVSPAAIVAAGAQLRRDLELPPEQLIERLAAGGYVREDPVGGVGEFSLRGGIVDVWPPGREAPIRVEFFGDTIESLREFDPTSQLSTGQLESAHLPPMRELVATAQDFRDWAMLAREYWNDPRFARAFADRTEFAEAGETFPGWEWLMPLLHSSQSSVLDHLADAVLVIDEPSNVESNIAALWQRLEERFEETRAADEPALRPDDLFLKPDELRAALAERTRLELRTLGKSAAAVDERLTLEIEEPGIQFGRQRAKRQPLCLFPAAETSPEIEWQARSVRRFHGRMPDLVSALKTNEGRAGADRTLFLLNGRGMAERVAELLRDNCATARLLLKPSDADDETGTVIAVGAIADGFELVSAGLTVYTEGDLFDESADTALRTENKFQREQGKSKKFNTDAFLSDFRDLKLNDYVVHIDHGIARFGGLQTLDLQGVRNEFMLLFYADDAKLYVPVERLDLVQRYSSAEGKQPTLDKLGGIGWQKTKAKAKRAMRDMADELLRLYAERKLVPGYAFSGDTPWQAEFEDAFVYTPTPDQKTAFVDVKNDMEQATPMDRLLCGDVGYGKTEVAMRAAFKAVMDGKQVAVLTPTTVLAYQHAETFRSRFAAFPVKIELLSRYRSPKDQKEVVKRLEAGDVDIIVGTHRILSKDIVLKDLGLVVVDEEQRFGVAHKERLKQLKKRVDVLTLSATPIPRTLNMSLMGLRDMSIIETPPRDRLAINTQVVQFSEPVVKSAIELELGRRGQVFFIHNRVESIETIAALVHRLVPQARLAIGHGQMNEQEMERVMLDFVDYKYDVLVATTIIENGIDIPRANTIIINRADNYGLSQLYQLRGRVGRSNRKAYAYLLIPAEASLTPIARRRLAAIREFSDLGAGFRVAALDLELRGAGSLLGGQQSGHFDALGFDLYTQMLERTVAELKGEAVEDEISVSLNLGVDVAIPDDYISDMGQRLRAYKRISSARDSKALDAIATETRDRFGRLPESVENLFQYARLRRLAEEVGVISIDRMPAGAAYKFSENARIDPERLMELVTKNEETNFSPNGILRTPLAEPMLENARELLLSIRSRD